MKRIIGHMLVVLVVFFGSVQAVSAVTSLNDYDLQRSGNFFFSPTIEGESPTSIGGAAPGAGTCFELAQPQINDTAALGRAINDHIRSVRPDSSFLVPQELGADIVQGAVRQGVNPMFVVGNLRMESLYATTGTTGTGLAALLRQNFNAFGRTAASRQPHFVSSTGRLWYSYNSWRESVNHPAASPEQTLDQPSLMRAVYLDDGLLTIGQYLGRYAPASDGNDESVYATVMREVIADIVTRAGPALSCTDNTTVVSGGQ